MLPVLLWKYYSAVAKLMIILDIIDPCHIHLIQRFKPDYVNAYATYLVCYNIFKIARLNNVACI